MRNKIGLLLSFTKIMILLYSKYGRLILDFIIPIVFEFTTDFVNIRSTTAAAISSAATSNFLKVNAANSSTYTPATVQPSTMFIRAECELESSPGVRVALFVAVHRRYVIIIYSLTTCLIRSAETAATRAETELNFDELAALNHLGVDASTDTDW